VCALDWKEAVSACSLAPSASEAGQNTCGLSNAGTKLADIRLPTSSNLGQRCAKSVTGTVLLPTAQAQKKEGYPRSMRLAVIALSICLRLMASDSAHVSEDVLAYAHPTG
jgi:hypothetical protein